MNSATPTVEIWRITDGKPGHENQTLGLAQALGREMPTRRVDIPALTLPRALSAGLFKHPAIGRPSTRADLILCAGHATHVTALSARRQHGGRIVVLMKPSLPLSWFDLCLIPEHDATEGPNVIATKGALNAVVANTAKDRDRGLILLGGPSRHAQWDDPSVIRQVEAIVTRDPRHWVIADSRRTPDSTLRDIAQRRLDRVDVVHWQTVERDWLREQLATASFIWVSEDSVSMVYEALSSGAGCGLLGLPGVQDTRVMLGIARLRADGLLVYADDWLAGADMPRNPQPLDEARRCARLIKARWFATCGPG